LAEESFQNNFFDTEYLKADLKGRSVRGGAVTMTAQGASFFLRMGSTVVLARLLTPQDFGLIAMVTAVTSFAMMFKDMGLSMATVQRAEINHNQISTLFWINVVLSLCIMLVTAALAPAIAWFYGEPRLTWITLALAGAFIFGGFTIQHQALLRRQMRFGALALIQIVSMAAGIAVAIVSAWYGAGYWSLVLMQLVNVITSTIGVWLTCSWRPGLPVRRSGVRPMLAFGGNLTGFNVVNYFARNLDNILIGWCWGAGPLGLYSKAYGLLMLPIMQIRGPIDAVATPALSRLQDDPERYRRYYYRAVNMIAFISMPLVALMAALSDQIIRIVLGQQWVGAANIFKVLAFAAILQPVVGTTGWVYVSLGQTKRMLQWGLIAVPLIITSFVVGLPWGALGVATSYTICFIVIIALPCLLFCFRYSPLNLAGFFRVVRCPMAISLIMYATLELSQRYFVLANSSAINILLYSCVSGSLVLVAIIAVWPEARHEAIGTLKLLKSLRSRTSTT